MLFLFPQKLYNINEYNKRASEKREFSDPSNFRECREKNLIKAEINEQFWKAVTTHASN